MQRTMNVVYSFRSWQFSIKNFGVKKIILFDFERVPGYPFKIRMGTRAAVHHISDTPELAQINCPLEPAIGWQHNTRQPPITT
jgi:hypothetical protein